MINKYVDFSSKSDLSKPMEEEEIEIRDMKLLYRNTTNREKDSGASSDEETTSSSLLPIPDSLRQMKNELKKTISDIGEPSEVESSYMVCNNMEKSTEKVRTSLNELRKKYLLKNETSVALKVNSANLMLDDILKNSNISRKCNESLQPKFFLEEDNKPKTVHETESSTTDSESSAQHCGIIPLPSILGHSLTPVPFGFPTPHCLKHGKALQPACSCTKAAEKGSNIAEKNSEENKKKKSFLERIQNFQIKYKVQSVYKMMQNSNPFSKGRREQENSANQQGIPSKNCQEDALGTPEMTPTFCKCEVGRCPGNQYPKRMIFDLVESSDLSQSDCKSTERGERHCTCAVKCMCPEVIPGCICAECTCKASSDFTSENPSKKSFSRSSSPRKTHEFVQTESISFLDSPARKGKKTKSNIVIQQEKGSRKISKEPLPEKLQDWKKHCLKERKLIERTDIYYFDHGNSAYYRTTDNHPIRYTECLVERTDEYATKFWAEIFGFIEVGVAFIISFILQLYRFIFTSIIRSLTVGILQITSDYLCKPCLTICFNGLIQPFLILIYNVTTSVRDLCLPVSQIFGFFAKEVAYVFRSCRLIEIHQDNHKQTSCNCGNKV